MKRFIIPLLLAGIICYAGCYITFMNTPVTPVYYEAGIKNTYYIKKEEILLSFIEKHLTGGEGQILSGPKGGRRPEEIFSESTGLMMNYCLIRNREDLFHRQFLFLKGHMLEDGRYIKWKEGERIYCNGAIDDLRIIRALAEAAQRWDNSEYFNLAGFIQEGIYNSQVREGELCELFDFKKGLAMGKIPLCYLDFYTMHRLETFNQNWSKVWNRGLRVVKNGRYEGESPLFYDCYSYENKTYSMDERYGNGRDAGLVYNLYTAIHLLEVNEDMNYFTDWLRGEMKKGKLYACYSPATLEPAGGTESTAAYALAAVYCKFAGEDTLGETFLDRMLKFMVADKNSPWYGGFGNIEKEEFYSFDNLTALWALALY